MSRTVNACACHTNLWIAPVAVSDEALEKITDVSIPTISLILRRMGFGNTFLSGCGMAPRRAAPHSRE